MIDIDVIKSIIGNENVRQNEDMSLHTTFRAGGRAALFLTPEPQNISELVLYLKGKDAEYYVIGNGSNLLVKDSGYEGAVICIGNRFEECSIEGTTITAGAGAKLSKIAALACHEGLKGFEFASGIPGTLGGAVTMNAGAYGGEMSQVLKSVKVLDENGNILNLKNDELNLGYRHSIVMDKGYVVLEGIINLKTGQSDEIRKVMDELALKRREKQPLEYPSAGSTFKRPEGYFAGKLIMDAGLAGKSIGGAQVSEKHCGFVINKGGATASDILELMDYVEETVYNMYGVRLEPEVKILG
ncbi:MAG: UDP-N-acetylmuramate dehydrogenase [Lachnospiraceae bacterium]|nr:UDP-N-acetylmuramate dehydrogenase [Lachnospiraceae bacterium]